MHAFSPQATPEISVQELEDLMRHGSVRLLDVREEWEFRRGRVPGAENVPLGRLAAEAARLSRDKPYAVICESGSRSLAATDFLLGRGFDGVVSVRGGTSAWTRILRPIERDSR